MAIQTTLIRNIKWMACMDDAQTELEGASLLIRDGMIAAIFPAHNERSLPVADEVIDASNHVLIPGMVNTHHHMYQSLTRVVKAAQDADLFDWLRTLYPLWVCLTPEMVAVSTQLAMAELLLSGCTTTSDHLYLYPNGCRLDDSIVAAQGLGMRFHACRGAMSLGESQGGLPPDSLVEDEAVILRDMQRLIEAYHDSSRFAMTRIALAPCSPFSVSRELMKSSAQLARTYKVMLHTHLAENSSDIAYSQEKFGMTPAQYAYECGWLGEDVWHAHCVKLDEDGQRRFHQTRTGIAHCPCSNMRLASGIAPTPAWLHSGIKVGIGVDGSASNDGSHFLAEVRQAMLLARVGFGAQAMSARQALWLATRGGAEVLGRQDAIGQIAVGYAADLAMFRIDVLPLSGVDDVIAALVFCSSQSADITFVNGAVVVRDGQLQTLDAHVLAEKHRNLSFLLLHNA